MTDGQVTAAVWQKQPEGVCLFSNDETCALSFDEIHGLCNLTREPAFASALDEVSR